MINLTLFSIAIALAIDAFSVSITCGLKLNKKAFKKFFKISIVFGLFQSGMALLGSSVGVFVVEYVNSWGSILAALVFFVLAGKTFHDWIKESQLGECSPVSCFCEKWSCLIILAFATSVDAFLVGIVLPMMDIQRGIAILYIGIVTFFLSFLGCVLGGEVKGCFKKHALLGSSLILVLIGIFQLV